MRQNNTHNVVVEIKDKVHIYKEQLKKQSITYLDDFLLSNVVFLEIDTNTLTKLKNNQDLNVRLQQTAKNWYKS